MNIRENFKEYIIDILSVVILVSSLMYLYFNVYYNPIMKYNNTIELLSQNYHKEEIIFNKQLIVKPIKEGIEETNLDTIPQLLTRINNTCKAPNVVIRTLRPHENNPFAFELKFVSNYFDFLQVLSEFEKLNIVINKIDIKPYEMNKNNSKHIISLDIEAINGGEQLSSKDINFLNLELNKKKKRDPFQRFAKLGNEVERLLDLTWMYKLSGIGKVDGKYVATIDHRVYHTNSMFNGMKIISINATGLELTKETQNGIVRYVLGFRLKGKK